MEAGGVLRGSSDERNLEIQMERQMGCMAGFLQIFDRHQVLTGRRGLYSAKRLPCSPSPALSCASPSERSDSSFSSSSKEIPSPPLPPAAVPVGGWPDTPARPSLPLPVFDCKEGAPRSGWKLREGPRLSLDSRVDGRGKLYPREIRTAPMGQADDPDASEIQDNQRRSPSVVARLMGLDALPGNGGVGGAGGADGEPYKGAELRRSASESRASRDLLHYQFVDGSGCFRLPSPRAANALSGDKLREVRQCFVRDAKAEPRPSRLSLPVCPPPHPPTAFCALQRKSFFDVQDYFVSELPKRPGAGSLYGEIEKRLRMRGIDEPAKDLETLKQILEAIQLKGLLHSRQQPQRAGRAEAPHRPNGRNFVYEHSPMTANGYESPIVVMQPASRSPSQRASAPPPPPRRNQLAPSETASCYPRRNHVETGRNPNPSRGDNEIRARGAGTSDQIRARSPVSPVRRQPAPGPQPAGARGRPTTDRRTSSAPSPKAGGPRKARSDPALCSPRNNSRPTGIVPPRERTPPRPEDDDSTTSDGSSLITSASSQFDFERVQSEYRDGRILLERCGKLLHSIAEMTSKAAPDVEEEEQVNAAEQQPSPVSVLDAGSSFDRHDAGAGHSPAPLLTKRCIDFEVVGSEERLIAPISSFESKVDVGSEIDDGDFSYVSEILRASSDPHRTAENRFWSPEAGRRGSGGAKDLPLHRRLVFDVVSEIVERRSQVSPWEAFLLSRSPAGGEGKKGRPPPGEVWAELRAIQAHAPADDLCEVICGVLRKDMAAPGAERAWSGRPGEMSDAVLDIERLVFKDLVADTIRHLAAVSEGRRCRRAAAGAAAPPPRRRLLF